MKTMNPTRLMKLALLAAFLLGGVALTPAADRFHFNVSVSGKTTNAALALITHPLSRSSVLKNISAGTGIPTSELAMIFDRESGLVSVVDREFGTNVFSLIRLESRTSVSNTNSTKGELFMRVEHATQENFDGSAVATVTIKRNALQEETGFKMTGKIHLAVEATDEDDTAIYTGVFSTGAPFVPRQVLP
jgi:hypothetical protein